MPELEGKIDAIAMRIPLQNVSLIDLVVELKGENTVDEINQSFKEAADKSLKGILAYSDEPLVSSDYIHNPYSAVVDGLSTMAKGRIVKILAWYDNEWGYSCRLAEMAEKMCKLAGF